LSSKHDVGNSVVVIDRLLQTPVGAHLERLAQVLEGERDADASDRFAPTFVGAERWRGGLG
jgi:hypothetical protein